jgi:hypothetical protein
MLGPQSADTSLAVVAAAMCLHRSGALRRAVLYEVEDAGGEKNLKDLVSSPDGKVRFGPAPPPLSLTPPSSLDLSVSLFRPS